MAKSRSIHKKSDVSRAQEKGESDEALRRQMNRIGQKLLVMSGKGGVGKSTVAVNLALSLVGMGRKVGLLDVDLHGPSVPGMLGLRGASVDVHEGMIHPLRTLDGLAVVSLGFMLSNGKTPVIWRGPRKHGMIREFLQSVHWGDLDDLIIDAPPGTGDEPLAIAQLAGRGSRALIVTTPQDLAIVDVRRSIGFCNELSLPVVGLIENMSGLTCPHCGESFDLFGTGGGEALAKESRVPFLGRIPIDPGIVVAGDTGHPVAGGTATGPTVEAFSKLARVMAQSRSREDDVMKTVWL